MLLRESFGPTCKKNKKQDVLMMVNVFKPKLLLKALDDSYFVHQTDKRFKMVLAL